MERHKDGKHEMGALRNRRVLLGTQCDDLSGATEMSIGSLRLRQLYLIPPGCGEALVHSEEKRFAQTWALAQSL